MVDREELRVIRHSARDEVRVAGMTLQYGFCVIDGSGVRSKDHAAKTSPDMASDLFEFIFELSQAPLQLALFLPSCSFIAHDCRNHSKAFARIEQGHRKRDG